MGSVPNTSGSSSTNQPVKDASAPANVKADNDLPAEPNPDKDFGGLKADECHDGYAPQSRGPIDHPDFSWIWRSSTRDLGGKDVWMIRRVRLFGKMLL